MNTLEKQIQLVEMIDVFNTCELAMLFNKMHKDRAIRNACYKMASRFKTPKMRMYAMSIATSARPRKALNEKYAALKKKAIEDGISLEEYFEYGVLLDGQIRKAAAEAENS